jgi:type II secretory pathway pseudopilin PulG
MKVNPRSNPRRSRAALRRGGGAAEAGFSLVEVSAAMVIFFVAMLGIFVSFTYAVNYNAGNSSRAQALAVLQQVVEELRSKKFTPSKRDADLDGGTKTPKYKTTDDGNRFRIQIVVDDDPLTPGVQDYDGDVTKKVTLKEITVTVVLDRPAPGWQTAVPAKIVLRRVRAN